MDFDTSLFICAVGLAFIFEGLPWALFPDAMRRAMESLSVSPTGVLRGMGLAAIGLGLLIVWLVRG